DEVGFVHDYVGRLQHRITQKSIVANIFLGDVLALLFVGRNALEPAEWCKGRQDNVKLRVLWDNGLNEDRRPLRIESGSQPIAYHVDGVLFDRACIGVVARKRVQIGNEVEALVLARVLEANPILEGALVVTEMKIPGRAHAADDSFL